MSFAAALQSGAILLREGLEAMLVIAVLAGALRKAGAWASIRALHGGASTALAASLGAAVVFTLYFNGAHDDRVEAAVMAVAAGLMFYMSGWLWLRQDPTALSAALREQAAQAVGRGSVFMLAFLAVFREGAETILFLRALATAEGGWTSSLLAGLVVAAALLGAVYLIMQRVTARLPLRPVFIGTSALLFVMGLRFVGATVQELQEQQIFAYDETPFGAALSALGFNPTWEAVGPQLLVVALAIAGAALAWRRSRIAAAPAE